MPNYLGTASGLTGIPSLLISSLQQVQDPDVQKALYQIQNWANSFYIWDFATFNGPYVTGGVSVTFKNPFPSDIVSVVATSFGGASRVVTVNTLGNPTKFQLWDGTTGAEIANGTTVIFFYIAVGH